MRARVCVSQRTWYGAARRLHLRARMHDPRAPHTREGRRSSGTARSCRRCGLARTRSWNPTRDPYPSRPCRTHQPRSCRAGRAAPRGRRFSHRRSLTAGPPQTTTMTTSHRRSAAAGTAGSARPGHGSRGGGGGTQQESGAWRGRPAPFDCAMASPATPSEVVSCAR